MYGRDSRGESGSNFQNQSLFQQNDRDHSNNPQVPDQKPAIKQESGRYKAPTPGSPKNQDAQFHKQDAQFCGRDGHPRNNRN